MGYRRFTIHDSRSTIIYCCILMLFLGACLTLRQPGNKISHYTLEYDAPKTEGLSPLPYTLRIERFTVAPVYNTSRIVYRDASFKREEYEYHKWRSNPGDLIPSFLGRDLRQSNLFQAVLPSGSGASAMFVVEGSVDEFLEWESLDRWEAVLSCTLTVITKQEADITKKIILQKTYTVRKPCEHKNPRSLASAMSTAMAELSAEAVKDIYTAFSK